MNRDKKKSYRDNANVIVGLLSPVILMSICIILFVLIPESIKDYRNKMVLLSNKEDKLFYEEVDVKDAIKIGNWNGDPILSDGQYDVIHKYNCNFFNIKCSDNCIEKKLFIKRKYDVFCPHCWSMDELEELNEISIANINDSYNYYYEIYSDLSDCSRKKDTLDAIRQGDSLLLTNRDISSDYALLATFDESSRFFELFFIEFGLGLYPFNRSNNSRYSFDEDNRIIYERNR